MIVKMLRRNNCDGSIDTKPRHYYNSIHDSAATSMARKYGVVNTIAAQRAARAFHARKVRGTALPRTDDFHIRNIII